MINGCDIASTALLHFSRLGPVPGLMLEVIPGFPAMKWCVISRCATFLGVHDIPITGKFVCTLMRNVWLIRIIFLGCTVFKPDVLTKDRQEQNV